MRLYNINANLIKVIERQYNKASSAVYLNGNIGELFRTTVGVKQGCLLSPTLFNVFLKRIMTDALEQHEETVSIGAGQSPTCVSRMKFMGWLGKNRNWQTWWKAWTTH